MNGAEIVREQRVDETIHLDRRVELQRQWLRFPASGALPPLSVERTCRPEGPSRPPVVLVHGFAQNRYTWRVSGRSMVGHLADEGHDVLSLELRGHGLSRKYGSGNARNFHEYVDDLVRVVGACDASPFVIGHSLGGGVAVGAATRIPLRGLIHMAGVFTFAQHNRFLRGLARVGLRLAPVLRAQPVWMSTEWIGRVLGQMYGLTDVAGYGLPLAGWAPGSMERELLEERLSLGFDWTSVEVMLEMCRWARGQRFDYADAFARLDVPLLVMAGDVDPLLPPGDARNCYDGSGSLDRTFMIMEPFEHEVHWGHIDLMLGRSAPKHVWPLLVDWMRQRG